MATRPAVEDRRLSRAHQSLQGLSCGDAFGERFFLPDSILHSMVEQRTIPAPPWFFTDDTMMALSIVRTLAQHGCIDQDHLARSFGEKYDPSRGYGLAMHQLLPKLRRHPASWRTESPALFGNEGSFGNGTAMRVAPLGAYFADDVDTLIEQAERSAVVTHCHREGVAGAVAIAVAAGLAAHLKTAQGSPTAAEFLERVSDKTPESEVRRGIQKAIKLSQTTKVGEAVSILGNGTRVTAPDTVPFALWASAHHLDDYEEAMWTTVAGMGDRDTTCAIVGGIVVMSAGISSIPDQWLDHCETIPADF